MNYFILESNIRKSFIELKKVHPELPFMDVGWGNGYALVFKGHPFYGKHYDDASEVISIHGGLTYSGPVEQLFIELPEEYIGGWAFGFDTGHYQDTLQRWPEQAVLEEARELFTQLLDIHLKQIF